MSSVAKRVNLSVDTIKCIFNNVSYPSATTLPKIIAIDELKGNSGGAKYHCSIVDPVNRKVIDLIKDRQFHALSDYFKKIKNRDSVEYFICDMWQPYIDLAKTYFKNAIIVIDKFHYIRHAMWAVEAVRKRIQKIVNSFDIPYTNACTEGFNNKIKAIKRNAFGYKSFDRFRNRILHCCN